MTKYKILGLVLVAMGLISLTLCVVYDSKLFVGPAMLIITIGYFIWIYNIKLSSLVNTVNTIYNYCIMAEDGIPGKSQEMTTYIIQTFSIHGQAKLNDIDLIDSYLSLIDPNRLNIQALITILFCTLPIKYALLCREKIELAAIEKVSIAYKDNPEIGEQILRGRI